MTPDALAAVQQFRDRVIVKANEIIAQTHNVTGAHVKALTLVSKEIETAFNGNAHLRRAAEEVAAQSKENELRNAINAAVEAAVTDLQRQHAQEFTRLRQEMMPQPKAQLVLLDERTRIVGRGDVVQIAGVLPVDEVYDKWRVYCGCFMTVDHLEPMGMGKHEVLGYVQSVGIYEQVGRQLWTQLPLEIVARIGHANWKVDKIR